MYRNIARQKNFHVVESTRKTLLRRVLGVVQLIAARG